MSDWSESPLGFHKRQLDRPAKCPRVFRRQGGGPSFSLRAVTHTGASNCVCTSAQLDKLHTKRPLLDILALLRFELTVL